MKNTLTTRFGLIWMMCLIAFFIHGQTPTVVGEVRNGVGVLTDMTESIHALKSQLSAAAGVSDVKLEYSVVEARYYLTATVTNDPVSAIGIQLQEKELSLYIVPVVYTCVGKFCASCELDFGGRIVDCVCNAITNSRSRCDMIQKTTVPD